MLVPFLHALWSIKVFRFDWVLITLIFRLEMTLKIPLFLANEYSNTLMLQPQLEWILKRQRVKVKSTNTSFQLKRHWKAHVSWWKYSIVTERKHYFAKRIENCLPINGNSEKKIIFQLDLHQRVLITLILPQCLSTQTIPLSPNIGFWIPLSVFKLSTQYPYYSQFFEYSVKNTLIDHTLIDHNACNSENRVFRKSNWICKSVKAKPWHSKCVFSQPRTEFSHFILTAVSNAGHASVSDNVEAKFLQIWNHPRLAEIIGDNTRPCWTNHTSWVNHSHRTSKG